MPWVAPDAVSGVGDSKSAQLVLNTTYLVFNTSFVSTRDNLSRASPRDDMVILFLQLYFSYVRNTWNTSFHVLVNTSFHVFNTSFHVFLNTSYLSRVEHRLLSMSIKHIKWSNCSVRIIMIWGRNDLTVKRRWREEEEAKKRRMMWLGRVCYPLP